MYIIMFLNFVFKHFFYSGSTNSISAHGPMANHGFQVRRD